MRILQPAHRALNVFRSCSPPFLHPKLQEQFTNLSRNAREPVVLPCAHRLHFPDLWACYFPQDKPFVFEMITTRPSSYPDGDFGASTSPYQIPIRS